MKLDIARSSRRKAAKTVTFAGHRRRDRRLLLATTALQATTIMLLAIPGLVRAAPAPNTQPTGGAVVAGQANISQTTTQTTVTQSSQAAAVNWQSYSVGSNQTVAYRQPSTTSITLNRVIGPDPSQIAGHITANGQIVLVNGSGVVFQAGSQVDVQSLIVSTAGVTNANFMAGKMLFDQAGKPGAKITNAGTISVASTGLAALVAPEVANSGVINAKLGHVVLAGAEASTIDLYGDGLMSVDVTKQVTHTPTGKTALVTNTGTIQADGGTIQLTAKAADGIMQNLVSAGGKLQANSVNGKTGTIVVSAVGGSITVEGKIKADGHAPGDPGGTIQLAATNAVTVQGTARISASGKGGGGTIAIGTTVQRAQNQGGGVPAGSATTATVAAGARIAANGRGKSSGGSIAILSNLGTTMAGTVLSRGGKSGGDGGNIEISSNTGLSLTGKVDTRAPAGKTGTLLIDPGTLEIGAAADTGTATSPAQTMTADTFNNNLTTNLTLVATTSITLDGSTALTHTAGFLNLTSPTINVYTQLSVPNGNLTLTTGAAGGGALTVAAPISGQNVAVSASNITLQSQASAPNVLPTITATVAGGLVSLMADVLSFGTNSAITAGTTASPGTVAVAPLKAGPLTVMPVTTGVTPTGLVLTQADLDVLAPATNGPAILALGSAVTPFSVANATATSVTFNGSLIGTSTTPTPVTINAPTLNLYSSGAIALNVAPVFNAPATATLGLYAAGTITGTGITVGTLTGSAGSASTPGTTKVTASNISRLGDFAITGGSFTLDNGANPLNVTGALNAGTQTVALTTGTLTQSATSVITAGGLSGSASSATLGGPNQVATLGTFTAPGGFGLSDTVALTVNGTVSAANGMVSITAPTMTVAAPASPATVSVTGQSVSLTTTLGNLVVTGTIGSCKASGVSTSGITTLTSAGKILVSDPDAEISGQVSVGLSAANGVIVSNGLVVSPTVTIGNGLEVSGGLVTGQTVAINGGGHVDGGSLYANTLNASVLFGSGDLYFGILSGGLTLDTTISGRISTPGSLSASSSGDVSSTAAIYAGGDATITVGGSFTQNASVSTASPSLFAAGGDLTILASGTIGQQDASASLIAGGALLLSGAGTGNASLIGSLAGNTVTVLESNAALTFGPSSLGSYATVTVSPNIGTYDCPGCATPVSAPSAPGTSSSFMPYRPLYLRLDGSSLTITRPIAADTIELHSIGNTTEGANGSLTTAMLSGTAGYAPTNKPTGTILPIYTPLTPSGVSDGTVTLASTTNNIAQVSGYQSFGSLKLTDAPGLQTAHDKTTTAYTALTLTGTITAGSAPDLTTTPTATLAKIYGKPLTINTNSDLLLGSTVVNGTTTTPVMLTGSTVTLNTIGTAGIAATSTTPALPAALGNLTETADSVITAATLTGTLTPNATTLAASPLIQLPAATLPGKNQIATLSSFSAPGGFTLVDAHDLSITGTVEARLNGSVTSKTGAIMITAEDGTGTSSQTEAGGAGTGHLVVAATALVTAEKVSLLGTDIVVNGQVGACELPNVSNGAATLTATGTPTASALANTPATIVVNGGGVVAGQISVTLNAAGGVTVQDSVTALAGGLIDAPTVIFGATAATPVTINGNLNPDGTAAALDNPGTVRGDIVTLNGGGHLAGGDLYTNTLNGGVLFTSGDLYSSNSLINNVTLDTSIRGRIATQGDLSAITLGNVSSTAAIYAAGNATITVSGGLIQTAGQFAAGQGLTILASGTIGQSGSSASLLAGEALLLSASGSGSVSLLGQLAGRSVSVIEPNADLTFGPTSINGHSTVSFNVPNVAFQCPGCVSQVGAGPDPYPIGATPSSTTATIGLYRPPSLRLDGHSLTITSAVAADTIELHSVGNTMENANGSLTTANLTGLTTISIGSTAGYTYDPASYPTASIPTAAQLPVYETPGLIPTLANTVNGVVTGGSVTLMNVANDIAVINNYWVYGDTTKAGLTLVNAPNLQTDSGGAQAAYTTLTLKGAITAGYAPDLTPTTTTTPPSTPTATLAGQYGASITITTNSDLLLGSTTVNGTTTTTTPVMLTGSTVTLNTTGTAGIAATSTTPALPAALGNLTETADSVITAATLTGTLTPNATTLAANPLVQLPAATLPGKNQIATLSSFSAPGGFTLIDARNLSITGTVEARLNGAVTAQTGTIMITAEDGTGTPSQAETGSAGIGHLVVAATALVTAKDVSLIGTDIVVNGQVGACELPTPSDGAAILTATGTPAGSALPNNPATIVVNSGGVVAGQVSATLNAPDGITVQSGGLVNAPQLTFGASVSPALTINGGTVFADTATFNSPADALTLNGGIFHANTVSAPANGFINYNGGDLYVGNAPAIKADLSKTGQIATAVSLNLTQTGSVIDQTALYANGDVTISVTGTGSSFTEETTTIAAGGNLTILATGTITQTTNGSLLAGNKLLLSGNGTGIATIAGQLSANEIRILEPNADLRISPTATTGAATVQVSLANSYECPGCNVPSNTLYTFVTPPAVAASVVSAPMSESSSRTTFLRLDGNALTIVSIVAADTVELHSVGTTSETNTGSVTTASLSGSTAGYTYAPASYPTGTLPTAAQVPVYYSSGSIPMAVNTVNNVATGGAVMLTNIANNIASINNYWIYGDTSQAGLTLMNSPTVQTASSGSQTAYTALTLTGTITAGSAPDLTTTPTATLAKIYGKPLTINTNSDLLLGSTVVNGTTTTPVMLTGSTVTLNTIGTAGIAATSITPALPAALGNLTETADSIITAATLTSTLTPNATTLAASPLIQLPAATLPGNNQIAALGVVTAPGGFQLTDKNDLNIIGPVSAASGSVAILANATTVQQVSGSSLLATTPATISAQNVTLMASTLVVNGTIGSSTVEDTTKGNTLLTASAGSITVNSGAVIGSLTSTTLVAATITQAGSSVIDGPQVSLNGNFSQADGKVVGGSVTVSGNLTQTGGSIWSGSAFTAKAPQVSGAIASAETVTLTGVKTVSSTGTITSDQSVSITAPGSTLLSLSGTIVAKQDLTIVQGQQGVAGIGGGITQLGGQLAAGGTATIYAADGAASQTGGTLTAGKVQVIALAGDNSFAPSLQPMLTGTVGRPTAYICPGCAVSMDPGLAGTIAATKGGSRPTSVLLDGTTLTLSGSVAGDVVELHSTDVTTVTGAISAGTLMGTAGYTTAGITTLLPTYTTTATAGSPGATFSNPLNTVLSLGSYQTPGALTLMDAPGASGLTIKGPVQANSVTLTMSANKDNLIIGDSTASGTVLTAGTVTLKSIGAITEASTAAIQTNLLTGDAIAVNLPGPNQIMNVMTFHTSNEFSLNNQPDLTVSGLTSDGPITLTLAGSLTIPNGTAVKGSSFTETSGNATNIDGSLSGTSGAVTLTSGTATNITGSVTAASGGIMLTSGAATSIAGAGSLTATSGGIMLTSGTAISVAGSLTATSDGITLTSGATTSIAGSLTAMSGKILLASTGPVALSGTENASYILVRSPTITLDGGTITVGGTMQTPDEKLANLPLFDGLLPGAFFEVGDTFMQTGTTNIIAQNGANATVRVDLTGSTGKLTFDQFIAPKTNLILDVKAAGTATGGPLTLNNLFVIYDKPAQGSVNLTGTVDGKVGTVAATAAGIGPVQNRDYQLNSCAVSSVNCIVLQPTLVPVGNPLKELSLNFFREQDDDGDLIIPNITEQGL